MRCLPLLLTHALCSAAAAAISFVTPTPRLQRVIPPEYLPPAEVARVVIHWTAGAYGVSAVDREHYHVILGADRHTPGGVKADRGKWTPKDNETCQPRRYAGHTRGLNTRSFGLSVACMANAREGGDHGAYPLTRLLWERLAQAAAEICHAYGIEVEERTVLQHWEVTHAYGIEQRGKWDIGELSFDRHLTPAEVAAQFRRKTSWYLHRLRSLRSQ